jgi:hypothetical protein
MPMIMGGGGGGASNSRQVTAPSDKSPRVMSGYLINDINANVEYLVGALLPSSEPTRVTRFRTCLCFFDGEMEFFDYGIVDVDIHFCNSLRTLISMSQAMNEMLKTAELAFGLEYQRFLKARVEQVTGSLGGASMKLRDRVLKDGRILPNDIIDVSSFMESQIDVNLMDDCAKELVRTFWIRLWFGVRGLFVELLEPRPALSLSLSYNLACMFCL